MQFSDTLGQRRYSLEVRTGSVDGFPAPVVSAAVCAMQCSVMEDFVMFRWDESKPEVSEAVARGE